MVCVLHQVYPACFFPDVQSLAQNQIMLSLNTDPGGCGCPIGSVQVFLRRNGRGSVQAFPVYEQSTPGNTAAAEAISQKNFQSGPILREIPVGGLSKFGSKLRKRLFRAFQKHIIGLRPDLPEHGRRQTHRHQKQQRRAEDRQFRSQLHRSSNRYPALEMVRMDSERSSFFRRLATRTSTVRISPT